MKAQELSVMPLGPGDAQQVPERPADTGGVAPTLPRRRLHTDCIIALAIVGFSALVWGLTLTFEELPAALVQGMGPAAFPRLVLAVIVGLTLWLAWSSRGRADPAQEPVPGMVYLTVLAVLVFMAVLEFLGIYGAILFACVGIGRLWGERRWLLLVAIGVGLAVVTHLAFVTGFGIPLPQGVIGH
jgi:putative tricarboxylic transport membrane protein